MSMSKWWLNCYFWVNCSFKGRRLKDLFLQSVRSLDQINRSLVWAPWTQLCQPGDTFFSFSLVFLSCLVAQIHRYKLPLLCSFSKVLWPGSGGLPAVSLALTWTWIYCKPGVCIPPWKWPKVVWDQGFFFGRAWKKASVSCFQIRSRAWYDPEQLEKWNGVIEKEADVCLSR